MRWEGKWIPGRVGPIYALDATAIGVVGPGKIAGNVRSAAVRLPRIRYVIPR
ncbi:hypothetical protein SBA3_4700010 [Candidatus Sulfopaludibacter sp. SbA3]|nr:hypothetical protein SBA3_4700010 [Candidatus Sulfopaludibacter sp. SbA3]